MSSPRLHSLTCVTAVAMVSHSYTHTHTYIHERAVGSTLKSQWGLWAPELVSFHIWRFCFKWWRRLLWNHLLNVHVTGLNNSDVSTCRDINFSITLTHDEAFFVGKCALCNSHMECKVRAVLNGIVQNTSESILYCLCNGRLLFLSQFLFEIISVHLQFIVYCSKVWSW